ncbi:N-acetylmuramoyl-L-alanine amidase family protein [Anaeroselena agilis]|uniref:N-acetylmuramoyl-L-alanine amidase n=1 Tax=Anaeroselena agilis TaxID=3063788 RepID=A0ABU3NT75_9FIRM|nr:N-acetylmuramoyl-L-alanine amidase [Selenomonadales bacterium 4137-cl]
MLRRALCFLVICAVIAFSPAVYAAKASTSSAAYKPGSRLLAVVGKTAGASTVPGGQQLTKIRWANHIDAVTGAGKLRLVIDATGPIQAKGTVVASPTPRLIVDVKGAVPGNTDCDIDLGGKIADSIAMKSEDGKDTVITVEMPLMVDESEYKVFTLKKDPANKKPYRVVIDINQPVLPANFSFTPGLKDKLIVLDPGHGGSDPGAIGSAGTTEKAVNLAVTLKVKALLAKAGAKVILTHQDDSDVFGPNASAVDELKARATVANVKKADIFVSIHSNAALNRGAEGTSTYYYQKTRYDSLLARNLQAAMIETGGLEDKGTLPANFYVIKRTVMPAALVELAFLSNPAEEKLLANPQFQLKMAEGIVEGMERFFAQAATKGGAQ